jgi:antitoxin (DNA-binding transcriptional repressor) of toxin-antitoxin stability system
MNGNTATIRELRTDFRSVKRKIEQHGEIVITNYGEPAYMLRPMPPRPAPSVSRQDYVARLLKRQPKPISREAMRRLWEKERGDR